MTKKPKPQVTSLWTKLALALPILCPVIGYLFFMLRKFVFHYSDDWGFGMAVGLMLGLTVGFVAGMICAIIASAKDKKPNLWTTVALIFNASPFIIGIIMAMRG